MTLIEAILLTLGILVLALLVFTSLVPGRMKRKSESIRCVNNLKQLGISFRVFADERGGRLGDAAALKDAAAYYAWLLARSNELATPRVLVCPMDRKQRTEAPNWVAFAAPGARNRAVSYLAAPDASEIRPSGLLFADRSLEASAPLPPFSYRAPRAVLGDLGTNVDIVTRHLSWTPDAMHRGSGIAALADGSVQILTKERLVALVARAGDERNRVVQPGEADD